MTQATGCEKHFLLAQEAMRAQIATNMGNFPFLSSLYGFNLDQVAYVALEVLGPGDSFVSARVTFK